MAEESVVDRSDEPAEKNPTAGGKAAGRKRAAKKAPARKKAAKKKTASRKKTAARKAAPKRKKAAAKKAPARKKAAKKKGEEMVVVRTTPPGAPTILVVGAEGKVEPIWLKYAQMPPTKPSDRPGIRTKIRVGNVVSWRTDAGKERIGVVEYFRGDSAGVRVGAAVELIRIARLKIVSVKREK